MAAPQQKTFITCAITGNLTRPEQSPYLPITPEQIATSALEAAEAGAAITHIHVRDPATGRPSMSIDLYRDVVGRIRARNKDLVINLTTGPGGRFVPSIEDPRIAGPGTTLLTPEKRVEHIELLKPDICTLDLNTMNSGGEVVINTPRNVRIMAERMKAVGVLPEIELFDSGDCHLARAFADGLGWGGRACSLVLGANTVSTRRRRRCCTRAAYCRRRDLVGLCIGRASFRWWRRPICSAAMSRRNEENIMSKAVWKTNAELVVHAAAIIRSLGADVGNPREARAMLGLA
jgi:uncharacterized protein (DUF849 family)